MEKDKKLLSEKANYKNMKSAWYQFNHQDEQNITRYGFVESVIKLAKYMKKN